MPSLLHTLQVLACLLLLASADIVYYKNCGDSNSRASFDLPSLEPTSLITAYIDLKGSSYSYNVELWKPFTYPPDLPDQQTVLTGSATFNSQPLSAPGQWRLVISPQGPSGLQFAFGIVIYANNQLVGKYVDVARYSRFLTVYHSSSGSHNVTLTLPSSMIGNAVLYLYGPFDTLTTSGGAYIQNNTASQIMTINYQTNGREYFYIKIEQSDSMTQSALAISIRYLTDVFQCPYSNDFSDVNGVYQGCSNKLPTYGFPCINYDNGLNTCTACALPWVISTGGVCVVDTTCPAKQYFSYGACYNVTSNCKSFQPIGGLCLTCEDGYTLQNYDNGTQGCTKGTPTCTSKQYLLGNVCMNNVDNCANFQTSTGTCLACHFGYTLNQNSCVQNMVQSANCQLGYQSVNGQCKPIDQNCVYYYNNNTCMLCAKGYNLTTYCQKIICGARQYSGTGQCVDVSPFCDTFDPINGNCLTCIYAYYLQNDGTCLQSIPSQLGAVANTNCPENYYVRAGTCVQVNPLCKTYNISTGLCTSCIDTTYFLNPSGGCVLISEYCGYRTYFSYGNCLPVSVLCDTYDPSSGYCLTCRDNTVLTASGKCIYNENCGARQYHKADGSCANVSPSCGDYDPTKGTCLTCASKDYEINDGVCCYAFNYMLDPICVPFYKTNCMQQHPTFSYCLKCASGFSLTNGVFGRCN